MATPRRNFISMIWVIGIILLLLLIISWFLLSPVLIEIDTRIPAASIRWISIGEGMIWFEEEWFFRFRILFFSKTISLAAINDKPAKIAEPAKKKKARKKMKLSRVIRIISNVIKTFKVTEWQWGIDTGDYTHNARLYPLNFIPRCASHLQVNFNNENYLLLKIRNRPLKILFAFLR